ncbi:MAG: T9SS type A sorting domain-containing protein [Bacteroidia bacterium]
MKHSRHLHLISVLFLFSLVTETIQLFAQTAPTAQSIPYSQDFSGLAVSSTTYPAGWQGWTLATASGSTFRTTAATGNSNLLGSSNASTTTGGIHNYNSKIGMLASGSIDPSICLALNTSNYANVQVTFDVMTLRNPGTRTNQVELQYQVGSISGTWTTVSNNVNGIYANPLTPTQTTTVTTGLSISNLSYTLPSACNNQTAVYIRWVQRDVSGTGSRSSFALDNITVCSSTVTPSVSISVTGGTNPTCEGLSQTLTATPTNGGVTPSYQWKVNGTSVGINSDTYSAVFNGGDNVTCEMVSSLTCASPAVAVSGSITMSVLSNPVASCTVTSDVTCFGGSSGSILVSASGGTTPYSGTGVHSGLSAGNYTYTVTDHSGCVSTCSSTITQPSAPLSGFSFVINDANCYSLGDGRIGTNVSNSVGTVHYAWSPSGGTASQATGLLAGTYTVTVSDDCSSFTSSQTISGPAAPLSATCNVNSNVTCFSGNDGSASVSAVNSVGTVGYSWSPSGGTGATATGLASGTYTVTVTDYCATPATCTVVINQPVSALGLTCSSTDETGPGANDGTATAHTSGGSGGALTFLWAPSGGNASTAIGLAPGIYTVVVTDGTCSTLFCTTTVGSACVPSTEATSASASAAEICAGNNVNLSLSGGSLGTGASWVWYEGGCGSGAAIGTGSTITTGAITGVGVHTFYARAEGTCGITSCVSVSVNVISGAPTNSIAIISFPAVGCVGGSGTITATTVPNASGYSWSGPAGILFDGNPSPYVSSSPSVTLTYTALPPAGISGWNVCVFAKNSCGNGPNTKCSWIRATLSTPALSGPSIGCPGNTETYIVGPVDGAASYTWTITGNATLNGGGATITTLGPSVNANFAINFTGGQICVFATTACGTNSGVRCINISNAPSLPGAISGSPTICPGSAGVYSISPVADAVSYIWSATGTGVSVIGSGTSATVSTTSAFTAGSVCVVAVSACGSPLGNSAQRCKTISSGKLSTPGNITGDPFAGVCGQTYTYSIPSMPGASGGYAWTIPPGATGSSSSNSITITFPSVFTSGTVCVHGINACGAGSDRCVTVYGNPSTPASLSGNQNPCAGGDEVYTWPAVPGASQYQVIVPVGYTVLSGTPTVSNFAVINVTGTGGQIGVKAVNSCGVSGTRTLLLSPVGCRFAGNSTEESKFLSAEIFPNPTSGKVSIQFNSADENSFYQISVFDLSGRELHKQNGLATVGLNLYELDLSKLSSGIYLIGLQTPSGNGFTRIELNSNY